MERRTVRELERRVALVLAQSFRNVRFVPWNSISNDGTVAGLTVEVEESDSLIVFLDYKGSALLMLDGKPYWSLDGYHNSARVPVGKHELLAEFSPYLAFGEKTAIHPGNPALTVRDGDAFRFWVYGTMMLDLAKQSKDKELSDDLLDLLSIALTEGYFENVTHEQLVLANFLAEKFPREIVDIVPESTGDLRKIGYRENASSGKWERAQLRLDEGLRELVGKYGKRGEVLGIAHGHIDTAWLWPFEETERKVSRTFSVVKTLFENYEELHYIQSMALYYEWTKRQQPELYEEIREYVRQGRWELGAGWVENDANMISGESFARQLLYSQRFYRNEFGKTARVYWLPDSFGFAGSIPQIAKLAGIRMFATHKLFWNDTNKFPYSLFNWVGIDGTSLPSIAFGHGKDGYNSTFEVETIIEQWTNWADKDSDLPMLYAFGYGDGGGGPTEEMLVRAEALNKLPVLPRVRLSGPGSGKSFSSFLDENYSPLTSPGFRKNTWRDELYLERHRGVQTSHTKMKYLNRRAEFALREAELWSTILIHSGPTATFTSRRAEFEKLWKVLLKDQFHDVLPGSSIREVYAEAYAELESVIARANVIAEECMRGLASLSTLEGENDEFVLFNSLPWTREREYVVVPSEVSGSQRVQDGYLIRVRVPGIGFSLLDRSVPQQQTEDSKVSVRESKEECIIENGFFRIVLDRRDGTLSSIYDKEAGREALKARSNVFAYYENIPGWGDAWDIEPGYKQTSFEAPKLAGCKVVEEGSLRVRVKMTWEKFRHSVVEQEIIVYGESRRIDFKTTTDLHDRELLLKVWFHFDVNSDRATFEIPFGNLERSTTTNTSWDKARFEVPMLKWADLSEPDYGVAMLNDGRYGISAEHSSFGLSIAKTPIYPDYATDIELSTFTFSVYPHVGRWEEALVPQRAYELNAPIRVMLRGDVSRSPRKNASHFFEHSFIRIDSDNVMVESVKDAEDDNSVILRLYEMHNKRGNAQLELWKKVTSARRTDLLETKETRDNLEVFPGNKIIVPYSNYQILTVKIDLDGAA